jgi:hypothetical protein
VYAALTVIAYGVLWAVALAHSEGLAGIAFRLTLGVLVGYSVVEAVVRVGIKVNMKADDNILMHRPSKTIGGARPKRMPSPTTALISRLNAPGGPPEQKLNTSGSGC